VPSRHRLCRAVRRRCVVNRNIRHSPRCCHCARPNQSAPQGRRHLNAPAHPPVRPAVRALAALLHAIFDHRPSNRHMLRSDEAFPGFREWSTAPVTRAIGVRYSRRCVYKTDSQVPTRHYSKSDPNTRTINQLIMNF